MLRDGGLILIIIVLALLLGAAIFAVHDPGSKEGFYQADPPGGQPQEVKP